MSELEEMSKEELIEIIKNLRISLDVLVSNQIDTLALGLLAEHFGYDLAEWTAYAEKNGENYEQNLNIIFNYKRLEE